MYSQRPFKWYMTRQSNLKISWRQEKQYTSPFTLGGSINTNLKITCEYLGKCKSYFPHLSTTSCSALYLQHLLGYIIFISNVHYTEHDSSFTYIPFAYSNAGWKLHCTDDKYHIVCTRPVPQAASVFCVRIEAYSSAVSGAIGLCDEPHGASDLMGNGLAISPLPGVGV